jgi:4-diphosphocytidyl-2-C-methyl-D-erythritol kinase
MLVFPNAKINLGLNVTSRRNDGYHNIDTVFYPVKGLCDILEVVEADADSFTQTGLKVDSAPADNLCVRACRLLRSRFSTPPVAIHLHKIIPTGAGLGGGSADATFMLVALNRLFALNLSDETLEQYAAELGSDCAFFVRNVAARASGRGEILSPLSLNLDGLWLLLVKPDVHVSTAAAYAGITPQLSAVSAADAVSLPLREWRQTLKNDFETAVFRKHPEIAAIKTAMYDIGALYASMSGSGATVFGLFDTPPDESKFAGQWRFKVKF